MRSFEVNSIQQKPGLHKPTERLCPQSNTRDFFECTCLQSHPAYVGDVFGLTFQLHSETSLTCCSRSKGALVQPKMANLSAHENRCVCFSFFRPVPIAQLHYPIKIVPSGQTWCFMQGIDYQSKVFIKYSLYTTK